MGITRRRKNDIADEFDFIPHLVRWRADPLRRLLEVGGQVVDLLLPGPARLVLLGLLVALELVEERQGLGERGHLRFRDECESVLTSCGAKNVP